MLLFCAFLSGNAQNLPGSIQSLRATFSAIAALSEPSKTDSLNRFLSFLRLKEQIPFTTTDSATFIVSAVSGTVQINGDHNSWGGQQSVPKTAVKLSGLDIYLLSLALPSNAKSDYKVVLGSNWILDPLNSKTQYGGFGPNSTFWMPNYVPSTEMIVNPSVPKGTLSANIVDTISALNSTQNGVYRIQYRVYAPADYQNLSKLPVVFFTDGHEYADANLGSVPIILDNKIASGELAPLLAVFIDPRNPNGLANRRETELVKNAAYSDFIANELIPDIDRRYKTDPRAEKRAMAGTSLGGIHSAWFAMRHYDKIANYIIHSPAFWYAPDVVTQWQNSEKRPLKVFLSYGTLFDGTAEARQFKSILESKNYLFQSVERSEGHSWGQWRTLIDEPLMFFFGSAETSVESAFQRNDFAIRSYPNPFNPSTKIEISLAESSSGSWSVRDLSGRTVLHSAGTVFLPSGKTSFSLTLSGVSSGIYVFQLNTEKRSLLHKITLLK